MSNAAYRHEQKYFINTYEYDELHYILSAIAKKDENTVDGKDYFIRSLYFDDYYNSAFNDKENGVRSRKKYRVRIYNCSGSNIKLECKHKMDAYILKESISMTMEEYRMLLEGELSFLLDKKKQLANEFYIDSRTNLLRPKVIVDYEREAFVEEAGTVRITFDKNVRAAMGSEDIFCKDITTYQILPKDTMILEVKFTGLLPEKIRKILTREKFTQTSASKFCLCADKIMQNGML